MLPTMCVCVSIYLYIKFMCQLCINLAGKFLNASILGGHMRLLSYSVAFLINGTPTFEWQVVRCGIIQEHKVE